jgi:hypothetical protein
VGDFLFQGGDSADGERRFRALYGEHNNQTDQECLMSLTNYGENRLLGLLIANENLYVGLHTVVATETGSGTEVSGGGYARKALALSTPENGQTANTALIQFPTATANWGTVTGFGLWNAVSSGNLLWYGILTDQNNNPLPKTVTAGDIFQIPVSNLTLTLD